MDSIDAFREYYAGIDGNAAYDAARSDMVASISRNNHYTQAERIARWKQLLRFLANRYERDVKDRIAVTHPERARDWNKGNNSGHRYVPLVRMLAERLAVAFHAPPDLVLVDAAGDRLPDDHPEVVQWAKDQRDARLDVVLKQLNVWDVTLGQCLVSPSLVRDKIKWKLHAPTEVLVDQDPLEPEEIESARHIHVELRQPETSTGYMTADGPTSALRTEGAAQKLYLTWRRASSLSATGVEEGVHWECWAHDSAGNRARNPLFIDGVNHYGLHPFVVFRGGDAPLPGDFWIEPREDWVHAQLATCLKLMDMDYSLRYGIHQQPVIKGTTVDGNDIVFGPDRPIRLEIEGSLDFLAPEVDLSECRETMQQDLRIMAVAESLPSDTFESGGSSRQLAAKKMEAFALISRQLGVLPAYRADMERTFEVHKAVGNYWATDLKRTRYSDTTRLQTRFADLPWPDDRFQQTQADSTKIQQGVLDTADIIARDKKVDRTTAQQIAGEREAPATGAAPSPAAATAGAGVPRPADTERS